ncbi:MAG TPA: hypothetical protein VMT24_04175 [Aggregatilineaceae bacterium]|nr:hypothetical protein [Aggregatilineaceae bacterium]
MIVAGSKTSCVRGKSVNLPLFVLGQFLLTEVKMCRDIAINIGSDFLLIGLITLLLWLLSPREVEKAHRFFGFRKQSEIKIYISGFSHPGVRTQKVVTALEYEVAVEKKGTLAQLPGTGFVRRLREYVANLIGQDLRYPEPDIEISPLWRTPIDLAPCRGKPVACPGRPTGSPLRGHLNIT